MGNADDWDRWGAQATDLILFSVEPAPDGSIAHLDRLPTAVMEAARASRERHGVRLHVCVGGAGRSGDFSRLAQPTFRAKFGKALLGLAVVEQLDGIDFDWEGEVVDEHLAKLMRGLKKAAKPKLPKLRLSVTVHPGDWYEKAFGVASHVHLMSYDACTSVPCRHSTLETAQAHAEQLLTKGLPAKKLVLGLP
eukprot:COSAG01_NODE_27190_length_691_cov_31.055743_1_plen_192_part_01